MTASTARTIPALPLFTTATGVQISLHHVLRSITLPARDRSSDVRYGRVAAETSEDFACLVVDAITSAERYPSDLSRALRLVPGWVDGMERPTAGERASMEDVRVVREAFAALCERGGVSL